MLDQAKRELKKIQEEINAKKKRFAELKRYVNDKKKLFDSINFAGD